LNAAEYVGNIPSIDTSENIGSRKARVIQKVRNVVIGDIEVAEAWNRFTPPPGLVPPVMLNWVWPLGRAIGPDTAVLRPEDVIGWARETE